MKEFAWSILRQVDELGNPNHDSKGRFASSKGTKAAKTNAEPKYAIGRGGQLINRGMKPENAKAVKGGMGDVPEQVKKYVKADVVADNSVAEATGDGRLTEAGGYFSPATAAISVGQEYKNPDGKWTKYKPDQIRRIVRHEYGHAADFHPAASGGKWLSEDARFASAIKSDYSRLAKADKKFAKNYAKQKKLYNSPDMAKELFAQGFADLCGGSPGWGNEGSKFSLRFPDVTKSVQAIINEYYGGGF